MRSCMQKRASDCQALHRKVQALERAAMRLPGQPCRAPDARAARIGPRTSITRQRRQQRGAAGRRAGGWR